MELYISEETTFNICIHIESQTKNLSAVAVTPDTFPAQA
jgi:hypothetical protein